MYSIDIIQDSIIFDDVLIYIATFDNITRYSTESIKFDPLHTSETNKYIVNCKLGQGKYDIIYETEKIHIDYKIDYVTALFNAIDKLEQYKNLNNENN